VGFAIMKNITVNMSNHELETERQAFLTTQSGLTTDELSKHAHIKVIEKCIRKWE
jgi:hypothetical protein